MSIKIQDIARITESNPIISLIKIDDFSNYSEVKIRINGIGRIKDYVTNLDYYIKIKLPINYPNVLPLCYEFSNNKVKKYHHMYNDGSLCLATEIEMRQRLQPDYSLDKYIELIIEYLCIYEYYHDYKIMPTNESSHGKAGVYEAYKNMFNVESDISVLKLLSKIPVKNTMKNKKCPCGSNRIFKKCHFNLLKRNTAQTTLKNQMKSDFNYLK